VSEHDNLDRAIEALLSDRSPRREAASLNEEERKMLAMAQMLRGSQPRDPDPAFVERLRDNLFSPRRRVSRRTAFLTSIGTLAAGVAAGLGIDRLANSGGGSSVLKPTLGTWIPVAKVGEVPEGAVVPITAGAVQGFLLHRSGRYQAMSRVCTHMGCILRYSKPDGAILCPCHGAEFDLNGTMISGPGGYSSLTELPPLPQLHVRVNGENIEVYGV
jgi:nitrite reductase/ring-hydroxylating ferredoxin subunit